MGIFGRKRVNVNVHGYTATTDGVDGRYGKQARLNRKIAKEKKKNLVLFPRTTAELCQFIEKTYDVKPLPEDDELYKEAFDMLSESGLVRLTVYNIVVMQGNAPAAWLTVYVEELRNYLAFRKINLECDDDYSVNLVIREIVNFFGAGKEDEKANNERYQQLLSVQ